MYSQEVQRSTEFRLSFMQYLRLDVKLFEIIISQCRAILKEEVRQGADIDLIVSFHANGTELAETLSHRFKIQQVTFQNCDEKKVNEVISLLENLNILIVGDILRSTEDIIKFTEILAKNSQLQVIGCLILFHHQEFHPNSFGFPYVYASQLSPDQKIRETILDNRQFNLNFDLNE